MTAGGGRLYIRLPDDQDPNTARVEVAKRIHMIDSRGMSHVRISGLTFRFTNVYWNLTAAPYWVSHESIDVEPGCVRLLGSGTDIEVTHCTFEHVHQGDPTRILDEHWCMAPYHTTRDNYYTLPMYPLKGVNIALKDYQNGPLENWTTGALHFSGRDQYAVLTNEDINRTVTMSGDRINENRTVSGSDLKNPQIYTSNFLIEAYFKTAPGQKDAKIEGIKVVDTLKAGAANP